MDFPFNFHGFIISFQVPYVLRQSGRRTVLLVTETLLVISKTHFKFAFRATDIFSAFAPTFWNSCCFVHYSGSTAFAIHRASVTAVARFRSARVRFAEGSIVTRDDGFHVRCATVTNFDSISIEDFVESVVGGEVLIDKLKKILSDVGFYGSVVRWIEP